MIPTNDRAGGDLQADGGLWHAGAMRSWRRLQIGLVALCLGGQAPIGCAREEAAVVEAWPEALPRPRDAAEATLLQQAGTRWTNRQARQLYLERVATIAGEVDGWRAEQIPVAEQAQRAFALRRSARMTARAMMTDPAEVAALQARDRAKYDDPDGPTFAWLLARARAKGLADEAAYQSIVDSAQRTEQTVNQGLGF